MYTTAYINCMYGTQLLWVAVSMYVRYAIIYFGLQLPLDRWTGQVDWTGEWDKPGQSLCESCSIRQLITE